MACFRNRKSNFHLWTDFIISFAEGGISAPAFFEFFEWDRHQITAFALSSAKSSHLMGVFWSFFMNAATMTILEPLAVT